MLVDIQVWSLTQSTNLLVDEEACKIKQKGERLNMLDKKKFSYRLFSMDKDYDLAAAWWKDHGWDAIPKMCLPDLGATVLYDGSPVCVGFLYTSNSAIVSMEHIVADKAAKPRVIAFGLDLLIENLLSLTPKGSVVVAWLKHQGLLKKYLRHGFIKGDTGMISVVRAGGL